MIRRFVASAVVLSTLGGASVAAAPETISSGAAATRAGGAWRSGVGRRAARTTTARPATYRVTLNFAWTSGTHPTTLPGNNPHISPPVVASHGEGGDMFAVGTLASNGIEAMAETGSTNGLVIELATDPTVTQVSVGTSIFGTGSNTFDVTLSQDASLVSLVTMLAPSPDWFVGIRDVDLFADGVWAESIEQPLGSYDSGTDNGADFISPNSDTNPAQAISGPRDAPFAAAVAEGPFGSVTISRLGEA